MTTLPPPDECELLSAYLDGELTPAEQAQVDALIAQSPEHRDELVRLEETRGWLRALPAVDPPEGFIEQAIALAGRDTPAQPKKHKWGVMNLVATAAVWVVVLGFVSLNRTDSVSPDVAGLAQTHTEASAGFGGLIGSLNSGQPDAQETPQVDLGEPYWAPISLPGDLTLRQVAINEGLVGLVYCNDADLVMLYEQPGQVDPDAMAGATETSVDGSTAWVVDTDQSRVVVVQRDDLVYAVVGPPDGDLVEAVADELPAPPAPSLVTRLGDAGRGLLDSFGLGSS